MEESLLEILQKESRNEVVRGRVVAKLKEYIKKIGTNLLPVGILPYSSQKRVKEEKLPYLNCKINSIVTRAIYALPLEYYMVHFPGFSWSYTSGSFANYVPPYYSNGISINIPAWLPNELGFIGMALSVAGMSISAFRPVGTLVWEGAAQLGSLIARGVEDDPAIRLRINLRVQEKMRIIENKEALKEEQIENRMLHRLESQLFVAELAGDRSAIEHLIADINDIRRKNGMEDRRSYNSCDNLYGN